MFKFFLFIKKIHFVLIFIVLEGFALHYYANSTSYTKAKLITASNYVVGGIYSQLSGLNSYFHLRKENVSLTEKIAELENEIEACNKESGLYIQLVKDEPKAFDSFMAHYGKFSIRD